MDKFLTLSVIGLCTAGVYAVAASGLVLTYTATGIFNFAHGAIGMLGAFTFWQLHVDWGLPTWLALAIVLLAVAPAFGVILEVGIMRGLQGTSDATRLVVSVSLLSASLGLGLWLWSPQEAHPLRHFWEGHRASIGGVGVSWHSLFAFGVAVLVAIGLRLLLYRTRAGITMRASVDDRSLTELNGGRPDRSAMLAWAIGCSMAALAGILIAPDQGGLAHITLTLLVVNAYAAAMIGRLRSQPLTFVGAVVLGLADAYGSGYLPTSNHFLTGFRAAIPVLLLFVVLIVLPGSRLRGASLARAREHHPTPTWAGSGLAAALLLVGVAIVATMVTEPNALALTKLFGFSIIALSLVPLVGYAGRISLCQMSFAGIGAAVMSHVGHGSPLGLVYAGVVAGIVGAIIALPALRLAGIYLALATGAFAVVLDRWIFTLPRFDVGPWSVGFFDQGTVPVSRLHIPGIDPSSERAELVVVAAVFCVMALLVVCLRRSRLGERLLALKDSPAACATLGLDVRATTLGVFALSAAIAGVGGAVYAGAFTSVSPNQFNFFQSLPLLLLAVVGGIGSPGGAVFAGMALYGIPIVASTWSWLANPLRVLPGLLGIGLARNPDGVVRDLQGRFEPLRTSRPAQLALAGVLVALVAGERSGALSGWTFGILAFLAIFAAPTIAGFERPAREEAWEWVGLARPFTADDERRLDEALGTPELTRP